MLSVKLGPFAVQADYLLLAGSLLVAVLVGRLAGGRYRVGIGNILIDMMLLAIPVARIAFVWTWFEQYRDSPWSIFDLRDGGFTLWAGLAAALLLALVRVRQNPGLRVPLSLGLMAGLLAWVAMGASGILGLRQQTLVQTTSLTTLAGNSASLSSFSADKPMVVNLWATWCPPCRREMPVLAQAQQAERDVVFVFVNEGDDREKVNRYLNTSQLSLGNVLLDTGQELSRVILSTALPISLFYDKAGHLVDTHVGMLSKATLYEKLEKIQAKK